MYRSSLKPLRPASAAGKVTPSKHVHLNEFEATLELRETVAECHETSFSSVAQVMPGQRLRERVRNLSHSNVVAFFPNETAIVRFIADNQADSHPDNAGFDLFSDQARWHRVVVMVDLDVIVGCDPALLPFGIVIRLARQPFQLRSLDR